MDEKKESPHYHGHRQRLRDRFLKDPLALPDYELIELMLYWVYPRRDVKPEAKNLLSEYKSLGHLLDASNTRLLPGVFFVFQVIKETARRLLLGELKESTLLNNPQRVIDYCLLTMSHLPVEQFRLFFLDRKCLLICEEVHQVGTLDQVPLYPREVLKRALELNATHLIMVHNHPSGDPKPSTADIDITHHLRNSLSPFNIHIVDHFIIGTGTYFSFREHGLITGA